MRCDRVRGRGIEGRSSEASRGDRIEASCIAIERGIEGARHRASAMRTRGLGGEGGYISKIYQSSAPRLK